MWPTTADANGEITLEVKDFGGTPFPAESNITVVLAEVVGDPFEVTETTDVTYEDYKVYAITVTETNDGNFSAKINIGQANTKVGAAITAGGECADFLCIFINGMDDWKFWHASIVYGGNWSFGYGEWYACETTSDANGDVEVSNKHYGADIIPGTIIYVALQVA